MKLLLVNPRYPESFWSFRWAVERVLDGKRAVNPPLGLATLAALTPAHWEVRIVDENVESLPLDPDADIVGVCGMGVQFERQAELLAYYRKRGCHVVAGGSFASLCPERYRALAHTVVAGEAEYQWARFCADFERGAPQALYQETGVVALADSPVPRFDLLKIDRYTTATMQFSRGCPYLCDFCDIIVMFGRKPRYKSPAQVERELDALRAAGAHSVFFVDDNLIGHRPAAKALLTSLAAYQRRHGRPFVFGTEASINLSQDPELLDLFRDAGFQWVFIGIESADPLALKEARKTQNMREDILTSVRRIYGHGMDVLAGFIIGFDNDTLDTFESQRRFIVDSGVQAAMVGLLTALPRTPLYERLEREGRLRPSATHADNTKPSTNVQPSRMGYEEMVEAYEALYRTLTSDEGIAARVRNKMRHLRHPLYRGEYTPRERIRILWRLFARGLLPGGPKRLLYFLGSLPLRSPTKVPLAVMDWIAGLSMRDYVDRHFGRSVDPGVLDRAYATMKRISAAHGAKLALSRQAATCDVLLCLRGDVPAAFFRRASGLLERMLARSRATVTLRIEALREQEVPHLAGLLERLRPHGDRVRIILDEALRKRLPIDSSVFHLVLA